MDQQHLVRMANNIGDFFEAMPDRQEALDGIAGHIKRYWEPRMRKEMMAYINAGGEGLSEIVREAIVAGGIA